jgi:hypothetical protein
MISRIDTLVRPVMERKEAPVRPVLRLLLRPHQGELGLADGRKVLRESAFKGQ